MSTIKVEKICKLFGNNLVLDNIDLEVDKGDVLAIVGPSGSGKTTLLRSMNLLEYPDSGVISVGDVVIDTTNDLKKQKKNIKLLREKLGFVFQSFNLFPHMTVLGNLIEGPITVKKENKEDVVKIARSYLEKVGMSGKENYYPVQLSGGQAQRVAIARALTMNPEVILFDEPTSSLDPELVEEVLLTIKNLSIEKRTMVIVTHEMSFARDVATKAVFMEEGRIIESGNAKKLFSSPKKERTKQFLQKFLENGF